MNWNKLETAEALRALSVPLPTDRASMTRRRFLQASAVTAGASALLPAWLADVAAATTPIGPTDGVLVIVLMAGGNDGMNMIVPTGDGMYFDARGPLAISEAAALPVATGVGLHPNLPSLAARYKKGEVALLRGVGDMQPDMSHFTAMARWMAATAGNEHPTNGWLGRWLDGYAKADDLSAVVLGHSVPLALIGSQRKATALPVEGGDNLAVNTEPWVRRSLDCLRDFGAGPTGSGGWADTLGKASRTAVDLAGIVAPVYANPLEDDELPSQLELAARLINANLGIRVLHVEYGDFDHHANQPEQHAARMAELDAGIDTLFATLSPRFARRVTVLTMSEFGRRPGANDSNGTDHGEASDIMAIGPGVRGGLYGEAVHLDHLSEHGCPIAHVDFRSVYATFLDSWLHADSMQVLGAQYESLKFLKAPSV